ncbi:MAG: hypothetical protein ACK40O_00775 [Allosphingosinicella sp.]
MIELPAGAVPRNLEPKLLDFGRFMRPPTGGRVQRVDRLGNRFAATFVFPPFDSSDLGRIVVSRLIRAKSEGIRLKLQLGDFNPGAPGATVVNGNGQAGSLLAVRGFAAGYQVREGQWFNHVRGDDILLYNASADAIATAGGLATVGLAPMMRTEPVDGDVLNFLNPVIQGFVDGDELAWQMAVELKIAIEFTVEEFL